MAEEDYVTIDLSQPVNGISQLKFPSSMSEDEMATAIRQFYSTNTEKSFIEKGVDAVDATIATPNTVKKITKEIRTKS